MKESFRTEIEVQHGWDIEHSQPIITIGSCFSDEIGAQLSDHKFEVLSNPFGTVYNPVSISRLIEWSLNGDSPEPGYISRNGLHGNLHFHSSFDSTDEEDLRAGINNRIQNVTNFLTKTDYLIITFGTAWVYQYLETSEIVSNCHKLPGSEFDKKLLSTKEIIHGTENAFHSLWEKNPSLRIILTVSPVRHLRDGFENNAVSKSILRIASHHLSQNHANVDYFPSYELVLDDLRDYRFYSEDMIHPNKSAVQYLWKKFAHRYFNPKTDQLNQQILSLTKSIQHRPFNESSPAHIQFIEKTISELKLLNEKVNLQEELTELKDRLNKIKQ